MTEPQQVVRASTPAQWLTVIPYLVGFPPRESVVVLGLGGENGKRVQLTLRVDAPPPDVAGQLAASLVKPLQDNGVRAVQFVLYRDASGPVDTADQAVYDGFHDALGAAFTWRDAIVVRADRWFSLPPCANALCCPPGGVAVPPPDARTEAELVYAGKSLAESREAIAATLHGDNPKDLRKITRLCEVVEDEFIDAVVAGPAAVRRWGRDLRDEWRDVLIAPATGELDPRFVARFLVGCTWLPIRDAASQVADLHRDAANARLRELTRRAPKDLVAAPATVLGLIASLQGDGCLANIAFDRALEAQPDYRFAQMLSYGLAHGVRVPDDMLRTQRDPLAPLASGRRKKPSRKRGARQQRAS
ncbi:MAG: DUF4192 domain-containing protein [Frankia sp.]|nr:DUF4192 domain-containing protein [Frankia sp.]